MGRICIVGGGYAGLRVARSLRGRLDEQWDILLVDRSDCHQLISRLPEIVAGRVDPDKASVPFERVIGGQTRHLAADVHRVDLGSLTCRTSRGPLESDWLVVAAGSSADFLGVPGAEAFTFTLKSVGDAVSIRERLADLRSSQAEVQVVIVGAGYTGTELAGELSALPPVTESEKQLGRVNVKLVAADDRLLPQGNERMSRQIDRALRSRGIPIFLGVGVARADPRRVVLKDGTAFSADLIVWAAQSRGAASALAPQARQSADGRLAVDPYMRVEGHDRSFACGDAAFVYDYVKGMSAPSSAQVAVQEGEAVAMNLAAAIRGRSMREFRPHVLGEVISLGGHDGVAEVGGVLLTGRAAAAAKQAALLRYLAGLSLL
ncbi:MAG TPA: FAD-dependent oxidoreductase [Chloroflexota bacterium]